MNYSKYVPSPSSEQDENANLIIRGENIQNHVKKNNLIKLKSCYYNTDSYFYDNSKNILYKVHNYFDYDKSLVPNFEVCFDADILRLNNLI